MVSKLVNEANALLEKEFNKWVNSRPPVVRRLAKKYPIGCTFIINDVKHYLLGYTEEEELILSSFNPKYEYEKAMKNKVYISPNDFEEVKIC